MNPLVESLAQDRGNAPAALAGNSWLDEALSSAGMIVDRARAYALSHKWALRHKNSIGIAAPIYKNVIYVALFQRRTFARLLKVARRERDSQWSAALRAI